MKHPAKCILLFLCLFLVACSKPDNDPNNTDNIPDPDKAITYSGQWQIQQYIGSSRNSRIIETFRIKGTEYYYLQIFTGYQTQYNLCQYENDQWKNCIVTGPNFQIAGATDQTLAKIETELTSGNRATIIRTHFHDPNNPSVPQTHQQTVPYVLHTTTMPTTENDFYLITRLSGVVTTILWKWNTTTNLWEVQNERMTEAETWSRFEAVKGLPGEFVVKTPWNGNTIDFHVYKNGQQQKTISLNSSSINNEPHVYPHNGKYVVIGSDKVYTVADDNNLTSYFTPTARKIIGSSIYRDKLFLIMGLHGEVVQYPVVRENIIVVDLSNGKVHILPVNEDWERDPNNELFGRKDVKGWDFKINAQNKVEGMLNLGNDNLPKPYKVIFTEALK